MRQGLGLLQWHMRMCAAPRGNWVFNQEAELQRLNGVKRGGLPAHFPAGKVGGRLDAPCAR